MNLMSLMNLSCICQGNNELINLGLMVKEHDEDKDKDKDKDGDKDEDKDEDFWQRSRNKAKELLESPCTVELFNAFADGD
jgi:hypothetical protein